jgi:hypothetical protein
VAALAAALAAALDVALDVALGAAARAVRGGAFAAGLALPAAWADRGLNTRY